MKKYLISVIMLGLGAVLLGIFYLKGASVGSDGFLNEPFFLLPLGYLFLALGLLVLVVQLVRSMRTGKEPNTQ